ncbi:transcription repressor OFP13-like [Wolffia australiana]
MARKMGFPYHLFKRACTHPKTQSFRCGERAGELYKTLNSVYLETSESWFTNSSEESFSTASEDDSGGFCGGDSEAEAVIKAARLDRRRLFFEPGGGTSSIMEKTKTESLIKSAFKESVVLSMESNDPYSDFRQSMEEMVAIYAVKDWDYLEELLEWYLRVNGRDNHGFIVRAFVDLLLELFAPPSSSSSSRSLPLEMEDKLQEACV